MDSFGFNQDQMNNKVQSKYNRIFDKYLQHVISRIDQWVDLALQDHANNATAINIINQIENKVLWLIAGQIGSHIFYPQYETKHPIVTTDFIVQVCNAMVEHEESLVMVRFLINMPMPHNVVP